MTTPIEILSKSITAVPATRYALGVAGVSAAVAIVAGFQIDMRLAVFGTTIMFGFMFVLVVFGALVSYGGGAVVQIALSAAWAFTILTFATAFFLMTSYFFTWPRSIETYLPAPTVLINEERISSIINETCEEIQVKMSSSLINKYPSSAVAKEIYATAIARRDAYLSAWKYFNEIGVDHNQHCKLHGEGDAADFFTAVERGIHWGRKFECGESECNANNYIESADVFFENRKFQEAVAHYQFAESLYSDILNIP